MLTYDKEPDPPQRNGLRTGEALCNPVVTVMTTAEPLEGHGLSDW